MATSAASNLPPTHRALVLHSTRDPLDMSVEENATPQAIPGTAVVRILAAAVLTYGGNVYSGKKPYPYPTPFVPGSSAVGRIAAVGSDATRLTPGQLVYLDCFIQGRDDPTALILHGLSSGRTPGSTLLMEKTWRDGTYAEFAQLPLENCFPMDETKLLGNPADGGFGYTIEDLTYLLCLSVPFGGLRDVDLRAGEKVIITPAAGAFGSGAVVAALAMGAQVVAMGRNMEALERVKALSPDRIQIVQNTGDVVADTKELTKYGPADIFFDVSPGKAVKSTHFKSCIKALRRGGRVSFMSVYEDLPLPITHITIWDITIKGKWMYSKEDIRFMIKLAETGFLKLGKAGGITTVGTFSLEKFEAAFEAAAKMSGPYLQAVITL